MRYFPRFAVALAAAGLTLIAGPVRAQTFPRVEFGGGYSRLTDASASLNILTWRPPMSGWNAEIAVVKSRRVSWIFAADGAQGRSDDFSYYGYQNRWRDLSAAGGIRLTGRWSERVVPHIQLLGGTFKSTQTYNWEGTTDSTSTGSLLIQPGVGVNVMLNSHVGVRAGVDLKLLPNFDWIDPAAGQSMTRVSVGGVVALGRRRAS